MTVNERIIEALAPLGVPVAFHTYSGQETTYITFFTYLDQPEQFADDRESVLGLYVQVDLWSPGDTTELARQAHAALRTAGFRRKSTADLYEEELQVYHKASRYLFEQPADTLD